MHLLGRSRENLTKELLSKGKICCWKYYSHKIAVVLGDSIPITLLLCCAAVCCTHATPWPATQRQRPAVWRHSSIGDAVLVRLLLGGAHRSRSGLYPLVLLLAGCCWLVTMKIH